MDPFGELFLRARAGEPDAVQEFFDLNAANVLRVIRARMNRELRATLDSNDFMQQARITLHLCHLKEKEFATPEAFLGYMIRIAERKVEEAKRKHRVRQTPLDELAPAEEEKLVDRARRPLSADVHKEELDNAIAALPQDYRGIIALLSLGHKHREVAKQLGISDRTVGRAVAAFGDILAKMREEE